MDRGHSQFRAIIIASNFMGWRTILKAGSVYEGP